MNAEDHPPAIASLLRDPLVQHMIEDPRHTIELVDTRGKHIFVMSGEEDLFGYSREEFMQLNGWSLMHPDDVELVQDGLRQLEDGPLKAALRAERKDGLYQWVELRLERHGEFISVVMVPMNSIPKKAYWGPIDEVD